MNDDLYPIRLYIFNEEGFHGEPILIVSEGQLHGPGTALVVRDAVARGLEVRMTDPMDFLLFHAVGGKILFPEPKGGTNQ